MHGNIEDKIATFLHVANLPKHPCAYGIYGAPFFSKLCVVLMGRFLAKNRLNSFGNKKYRLDFCTDCKISGDFFDRLDFVRVAKYRVDF